MRVLMFALLLGLPAVCSARDEPSAARKVLFFDLWKLDYWDNISLQTGKPEWVRECAYHDPAFPDHGINFPSVWRDPDTGKWRMNYSIKWSPFTIMTAESEDGVKWQPAPHPGISPGPGEEKLAPNHLFTVPGGSGGAIYHDPKSTDGYRFRIFGRQRGAPVLERARNDPGHPWHEAAQGEEPKHYIDAGITLVSRDALHWELKTGGHWNWQTDDWYPEPPVFAFWNERSQTHTMAARPGWGDRRQCLLHSPDLKSWSAPQLQFQPDPLDTAGPVGMYGLPVHPVGNGAGFVGLLWMFHNSSSRPVNSFNQFFGTMDAHLTYSYDGIRFFRGPRNPFIARNPMPHPGCVQVRPCSIVETTDSIHIYSEANRGAHGRERSQQRNTDEPLGTLVLHRLRKDGWMKLVSEGDWARIQTKPFALRGAEIRINANAKYGEVRFQLTDEKSVPIPGFTFADCQPLRAKDSLAFEMQWKEKDPQQLIGTPLRLEIEFRQAEIYSFEMNHHFLDAHDMWLLKDGKTLPDRPRFDF